MGVVNTSGCVAEVEVCIRNVSLVDVANSIRCKCVHNTFRMMWMRMCL